MERRPSTSVAPAIPTFKRTGGGIPTSPSKGSVAHDAKPPPPPHPEKPDAIGPRRPSIILTRQSTEVGSLTSGASSIFGMDGSLFVPNMQKSNMNRKHPRILDHKKLGMTGDLADDTSEHDISVDPTELDPYLLALAVCEFQPVVFLREFVLHMLMVLLPFTVFNEKFRIFCYNHDFIGTQFGTIIQWHIALSLLGCSVIMVMNRPPAIQWDEFSILLGQYLMRIVIIAFKYAFTSPIEISLLTQERVDALSRTMRQVLTGWNNPTNELVEIQLLLASTRNRLDLTQGHFLIKTDHVNPEKQSPQGEGEAKAADSAPVAEKVAVLTDLHTRYAAYLDDATENSQPMHGAAVSGGTGSAIGATNSGIVLPTPMTTMAHLNRVSAYTVVFDMILESLERVKFKNSAFLPSLLYTAIPFIARASYGLPIAGGTGWTAIVFSVLTTPINLFLMITNLGFILVCVTDFQRREFLFMRLKAILLDGFISTARSALSSNMPPQSGCPDQNQKGNMKKVKEEDDASDGNLDGTGQQQPDCEMRIKKNEKMLLSADDRLLVRLDMDDSHNLLMFWYTRIILQDYGRPYLLRLQFYIGTFIIFCVLVGVQLAAFLFGYLESMTIVAQYQSVAILIMMLVLVLRVLFHGLAANNERKLHAEQLFKKSIVLATRAERVQHKTPTKAADLRDAGNLCWVLANACNNDELLNAVRVLGIPVDYGLVSSFGTIMAAAISAGLQSLRSSTAYGKMAPPPP